MFAFALSLLPSMFGCGVLRFWCVLLWLAALWVVLRCVFPGLLRICDWHLCFQRLVFILSAVAVFKKKHHCLICTLL